MSHSPGTDVTVEPPAGGLVAAVTVTGPDAYGDPAVVGVLPSYAREDHDHGLPAAPAVPAAGNTVTGPDAYGAAASAGVLGTFSREDHDHGLPAAPPVPGFAAPGLTLGVANAAGASGNVLATDSTIAAFDAVAPVTQAFSDVAATGAATVAARRDHVHGMPTNPAGSVLLASSTLVADGTFDFTAISGAYTDLRLMATLKSSQAGADTLRIRFNNDATNTYDSVYQVYAAGARADGSADAGAYFVTGTLDLPGTGSTAGVWGYLILEVPNYAGAVMKKICRYRSGYIDKVAGANNYAMIEIQGFWRSTAAISRVTVYCGAGNLLAGSKAWLYGLK